MSPSLPTPTQPFDGSLPYSIGLVPICSWRIGSLPRLAYAGVAVIRNVVTLHLTLMVTEAIRAFLWAFNLKATDVALYPGLFN